MVARLLWEHAARVRFPASRKFAYKTKVDYLKFKFKSKLLCLIIYVLVSVAVYLIRLVLAKIALVVSISNHCKNVIVLIVNMVRKKQIPEIRRVKTR